MQHYFSIHLDSCMEDSGVLMVYCGGGGTSPGFCNNTRERAFLYNQCADFTFSLSRGVCMGDLGVLIWLVGVMDRAL